MRRRLIIGFWFGGVVCIVGGVWVLFSPAVAAIVLGLILVANAMLARSA